LQYVRGTNWAIACAALAALPKRHDGEEAVDEILGQFYRLVGWAMYFALALSDRDRSAAGGRRPGRERPALVTNFPIVPLVFRDYFARRAALGDRAEFAAGSIRRPPRRPGSSRPSSKASITHSRPR
jgi:hypothetical protein